MKMNIKNFLEELKKIGYIFESDTNEDSNIDIKLIFDNSHTCVHRPFICQGIHVTYAKDISIIKGKIYCSNIEWDISTDEDFSFEEVLKILNNLMFKYKQLKCDLRKDKFKSDFY